MCVIYLNTLPLAKQNVHIIPNHPEWVSLRPVKTNHSDYNLLGTYYVLSTILGTLYTLSQLILSQSQE